MRKMILRFWREKKTGDIIFERFSTRYVVATAVYKASESCFGDGYALRTPKQTSIEEIGRIGKRTIAEGRANRVPAQSLGGWKEGQARQEQRWRSLGFSSFSQYWAKVERTAEVHFGISIATGEPLAEWLPCVKERAGSTDLVREEIFHTSVDLSDEEFGQCVIKALELSR